MRWGEGVGDRTNPRREEDWLWSHVIIITYGFWVYRIREPLSSSMFLLLHHTAFISVMSSVMSRWLCVYSVCVSLSLSVALQVFLQSFLLQFGSLPLVQSFLDVWPLRPLIVWYSHIITSLHVQTNNIGVHAPPQALMKRPETRVQQYTVHHPHLTQKCRGAQ